MVYHQVQFLTPVQSEWIPVKAFAETSGAMLPVTDSAEQLSLEEAQTRLLWLTKMYPFLTFRMHKVVL